MEKRQHILVIDDDPVMRELLEALLALSGYTVEVFSSGDAGVARLREPDAAFSAVLTDLHMPGLQGVELAAALEAARQPQTALVGMSGSSPSVEETRLLDSFLQKPFTVKEFDVALQRARTQMQKHEVASGPIMMAGEVMKSEVFARLQESFSATTLRGLYNLTLTDVRERIERMSLARQQGDQASLRREAHAIKGGCGMVGASELVHLAATTEEGTDLDAEGIAKFSIACNRLEVMLEEKLGPL